MDAVCDRLEQERLQAWRRVAGLSDDLRAVMAASRDTNADDEHDPEVATIAFERSQVDTLLRDATRHLEEVDAAVGRLNAGSYGRCEVCGCPVDPRRLEARPVARTCVGCATSSRHAP